MSFVIKEQRADQHNMNTKNNLNTKNRWGMIVLTMGLMLILAPAALAHCPLCTIGAAAVAGGAYYLGVKTIVIGIFIGAFAASTGWWLSNIIKKQYIRYQRLILVLLSFALTIIPLLPLFSQIGSLPIWWFGEYGSLFNRVYIFNTFLIGSIGGLGIVAITPWLSKQISTLREGKIIPFQGVMLTIGLLLITGVLLQLVG